MDNEFEPLYAEFNRRDLIAPDPLQLVWEYDNPADREVVGLIASSLAFGSVGQIVKSVSAVLERMPEPAQWVKQSNLKTMRAAYSGFRHRFVDGDDLARLLFGMQAALRQWGSLRACFETGLSPCDRTVVPALSAFVGALGITAHSQNYLLPSPTLGSACKRLNLFVRWMVRSDNVDPGVWKSQAASKLLIPLDTHMHRIGLRLGFTTRRQGDLRTAIEITEGFGKLCPEDPVRYDFALTHLSMRDPARLDDLLLRVHTR